MRSPSKASTPGPSQCDRLAEGERRAAAIVDGRERARHRAAGARPRPPGPRSTTAPPSASQRSTGRTRPAMLDSPVAVGVAMAATTRADVGRPARPRGCRRTSRRRGPRRRGPGRRVGAVVVPRHVDRDPLGPAGDLRRCRPRRRRRARPRCRPTVASTPAGRRCWSRSRPAIRGASRPADDDVPVRPVAAERPRPRRRPPSTGARRRRWCRSRSPDSRLVEHVDGGPRGRGRRARARPRWWGSSADEHPRRARLDGGDDGPPDDADLRRVGDGAGVADQPADVLARERVDDDADGRHGRPHGSGARPRPSTSRMPSAMRAASGT